MCWSHACTRAAPSRPRRSWPRRRSLPARRPRIWSVPARSSVPITVTVPLTRTPSTSTSSRSASFVGPRRSQEPPRRPPPVGGGCPKTSSSVRAAAATTRPASAERELAGCTAASEAGGSGTAWGTLGAGHGPGTEAGADEGDRCPLCAAAEVGGERRVAGCRNLLEADVAVAERDLFVLFEGRAQVVFAPEDQRRDRRDAPGGRGCRSGRRPVETDRDGSLAGDQARREGSGEAGRQSREPAVEGDQTGGGL